MTYERAMGLAAKTESAVNTMANSKGPAFSNTLGKAPIVNKGNSKFTSSSSTGQPGYGSGSSSYSTAPSAQAVTKLNQLTTSGDPEGEANMNEEGEGISLNAVFKKLSSEERTKLMKEGRCFFCREVGHITKNCPKRSRIYPKPGNQGKGEARQQ
jgi:hypothetical protein